VWVRQSPSCGLRFSNICFHKRLRILKQLFTHVLHVPIYARLQIFIQLSLTLTNLCHIKRDYLVHLKKFDWWSRLIYGITSSKLEIVE